jgi:hypothetical protein
MEGLIADEGMRGTKSGPDEEDDLNDVFSPMRCCLGEFSLLPKVLLPQCVVLIAASPLYRISPSCYLSPSAPQWSQLILLITCQYCSYFNNCGAQTL